MALTKAQERRAAATRGLIDGLPRLISEWTPADFDTVLERMAAAVKLGRTERWQDACAFAADEIAADPTDAQRREWAIVQGQIWMAHAID